MQTHAFHSVNNGVYLLYKDTGVFFDGIHKGHDYGFSDTPEMILNRCYNLTNPFENLKALLFTHRHADHYDREEAMRIAQKNGLFVYAPKHPENSGFEKLIDENTAELNIGDMQIFAVKTIHDGAKKLQRERHVSFIVNTPSESFFVAGDAGFKPEEADKFQRLATHKMKAVFGNPYQILSDSSRAVLLSLEPEKIILCHLPFEKDDRFNVHLLFKEAVKRYVDELPQLTVPEYNSWMW